MKVGLPTPPSWLFAISMCLGSAVAMSAYDDDDDASGFNSLRIENEEKLLVPPDKTEEVWRYIEQRYVRDIEFLKQLDPRFKAYWYDEYFTDHYFDTASLEMLAKQSSIRVRTRVNRSDPDHRKSGRSLVQFKLSNVDPNRLNRGEIKFKAAKDIVSKTSYDGRPLLLAVDEDFRREFMNRASMLGIDPNALTYVLTVEQRRRRIYIERSGSPFMSISLDEVAAKRFLITHRWVEIEPELNEIPYTKADETTRRYMEGISEKIMVDLLQKFPDIKSDLTPKYNKAFARFESTLPFFRFLFSWGIL